MSENLFQKAEKKKSKLRLALFGVSGAGKTYTALSIATGFLKAKLGKKIAVIDSEHQSAMKYSDRFEFDIAELENKKIAGYINYIQTAQESGYDILIIDSITHAWKALLAEIDRMAEAKYSGNSFRAWGEGTPMQNSLIEAILSFKGHIIVTMRSKTAWSIKTDDGKMKPIRAGMEPEQGKGIEYEFDLLIDLSPNHTGHVLKDRTGKYQDKTISKPGEKFGIELAEWLNDGKDDLSMYIQSEKEIETKNKIVELAKLMGWDGVMFLKMTGIKTLGVLKQKTLNDVKADMENRVKKYQESLKEKHSVDTPPAEETQQEPPKEDTPPPEEKKEEVKPDTESVPTTTKSDDPFDEPAIHPPDFDPIKDENFKLGDDW